MSAVAELGYVPNRAASDLAANRSGTVGVLVPALSPGVFADAIGGLEKVLGDAGIQLFIGTTGYDDRREEQVLRAFLGRRPDGIVLVDTATHSASTRATLMRSRVPVVEISDWTSSPIGSLVGFSSLAALSAIATYVVDRGYRHPAFVGWLSGLDAQTQARRDDLVSTIEKLRPGRVVPLIDSGNRGVSIEAGRWLLDATLSEYPDTDVVVCANDLTATGALLEALNRGLRVPDDIAITGFGDDELSKHLRPALTTVQTPHEQSGFRAAELLLEHISSPGLRPVTIDLGFTMLPRESA